MQQPHVTAATLQTFKVTSQRYSDKKKLSCRKETMQQSHGLSATAKLLFIAVTLTFE